MTDDTPQPEITSRNIPLPIQREVRQRCGFGCVICGLPLYEYEHLLGWANVQRHVADEITLLCSRHHDEKTRKLLPVEEVEAANLDPFNKRSGVSPPYDLHFSGSECFVKMGSDSFQAQFHPDGGLMIPIIVDGLPLLGFTFEDGHLLLTVNLFDEFNRPILAINRNELTFTDGGAWDIQLVGQKLDIRAGAGRFLLQLEFHVPDTVVVKRGRFLLNGAEVIVEPSFAVVPGAGVTLSGNRAMNCQFGIAIGTKFEGMAIKNIPGLSRYDEGKSKAAIAKAKASISRP